MSITKYNLLLPAFTAVHSLSAPAVSCNTSYKCLSTRDIRFHQQKRTGLHRNHATIADDSKHDQDSNLDWPDTPQGQNCPTPYQIFAISKTAPYSKARFYELVKLYHPDKSSCDVDSELESARQKLSHATKLERYRLVVAAHAILSDPVKRSAYDRWGAGWAGKADTATWERTGRRESGQPGPFTAWNEHTDHNIWSNATWEDWERWRRKQEYREGQRAEPQNPLYLQNSTFISIIMVLAAVGSSLNYNRAEAEGGRFLAARDAVHDQASKELRKVRQATNQRPKEERIEWFVKNREASLSGFGVDDLREEKARHVLPPPESCMGKELPSDE